MSNRGTEVSIICQTHVELVRARKALEKAFVNQDWVALREMDIALGELLNKSFEDEARDAPSLVREMEHILNAYSRIISQLPESASEALALFPHKR